MHLRTLVRVTAACLALAACESSTEPTPLGGAYTLLRVDGKPVPATLDSASFGNGSAYTVRRLVQGSVEILGGDSAMYTRSERTVTFFSAADSVYSANCITVPLPYRVQGDRLLLIIEPALWGQPGRLRVDSLQIGDDTLVQDTRRASGAPLQLEYVAFGQAPARCGGGL